MEELIGGVDARNSHRHEAMVIPTMSVNIDKVSGWHAFEA
jgi:hypothetical protein